MRGCAARHLTLVIPANAGFSTAEWRVIRFSRVSAKKLDPGVRRDDGFKWRFSMLR
jgi:hypothetical protein